MGEHCEEMAKTWRIGRREQDELALESHRRAIAAQQARAADGLVPVDGLDRDQFPRPDTSLEKLAALRPAFDRSSGTITAGNSSPLTDGAAGVWVATEAGLARLPSSLPRALSGGLRDRGGGPLPRRPARWRRSPRSRACWRGTA